MYLLVTKKYLLFFRNKMLVISLGISSVIIFISYELLSWYHFGDIPTIMILFRLIFGIIILTFIIYKLIIKKLNI
mgnify:CR=1 FL=1